MPHENLSRETTFGYLSTVHTAEHGYFGGYLVISALGRPLEFHCTSPVRPSRAHEILYGPTLQAYVLGEQIGGTLLGAGKLTPRLIVTDQAAMLAVRPRAGVPVAFVQSQTGEQDQPAMHAAAASGDDDGGNSLVTGVGSESSCVLRMFGQHALQMPPGYESEREVAVELLALVARHVDLIEPFGRIHEAIREAQRIGVGTLEGHGQAA